MKHFRIHLSPIRGVTVLDSAKSTSFRAEDVDPQFLADVDVGIEALAPGWYLLDMKLVATSGDLAWPCLYPDYGNGYSEALRIPLPNPVGGGGVQTLILFPTRLRSLRFDPSVRPADFKVDSMSLRRLSRLGALLQMLKGIHRNRKSVDGIGGFQAACEFAVEAVAKGVEPAVAGLVYRYSSAVVGLGRSYSQWVEKFEARVSRRPGRTPDSQDARVPLLSVLMPVFDTDPLLLRRAIESVKRQTYSNWELCIADDASSRDGVRPLLAEMALSDQRIKVVSREKRGHICDATNTALNMARGRYVGFLDHDDELHPEALFCVARAFREYPLARLVYTDEDKIDETGRRHDPHFKPGWNQTLLMSQNYICHFLAMERSLLDEVGGLRAGTEGAQDHDLLLRSTGLLEPQQIVHVPRVLYHWRTTSLSTASDISAKPYALNAGRAAVSSHLDALNIAAEVSIQDHGYYRVRPQLPDSQPLVSIVIPTKDRASLLECCIESILNKSTYDAYEIVVVDNGSSEPDALALLDRLTSIDRVKLVRQLGPFNFSRLVNAGVDASTGEYVCLLNNDTEVISADWIEEMVSQALLPRVGVVGAMLYYPDDTIQHAGVVLGIGGVAAHVHGRLPRGSSGYMSRASLVQNMSAVTGACLLVSRVIFDKVNGFDCDLAVAFNDVDFCLRVLKEGYFNVWTPYAELYHHESASRGYEDTVEKQERFSREAILMRERWAKILDNDLAYSPNLTLERCDFSLAFPPRDFSPRPGLAWSRLQPNDESVGFL